MNDYPRTTHTLRLKETHRRVPARRYEATLAGSVTNTDQASTAPAHSHRELAARRAAKPRAIAEPSPAAQAPVVGATAVAAPEGSLRSEALLAGKRLVQILHNGSIYELRATRLGKLILTK